MPEEPLDSSVDGTDAGADPIEASPRRSDTGSGPAADELAWFEEGQEGVTSGWSVPWSDLMMTMFVLFVALFVYEAAEREFDEALTPPVPDATDASRASLPDPLSFGAPGERSIFEQAEAVVRETNLENVEVELRSDRSVRLSVRGPMFFDLGRAELRPATREFLGGIAKILRTNDLEVEVVGHTDSYPISNERFATNWELSTARASAVIRFLVAQGGIDPGRFSAIGHSMYRPAAPNSSADNKAMNRRVEIIITRRPYRPSTADGT